MSSGGRRVAVLHGKATNTFPYLEALRSCGLEPAAFDPQCGMPDLDAFEGLMLCGGTDVDPALYGQVPDPKTGDPDRERDGFEFEVLRLAIERKLPILAICRGMQVLNVIRGGTLVQDIPNHQHRPAPETPWAQHPSVHEIDIVPGSLIAEACGPGPFPVNSRHHQAIDRPGRDVRITAWSGDGVAEAAELQGHPFCLAVQWHPENMVESSRLSARIFELFRAAFVTV